MGFCTGNVKKTIFLLIAFFSGVFLWAQSEETRICIESARTTSYYTDEKTEDEIILLVDNVVISIVQDSVENKIVADTVNYNRTKNMVYASGNVKLTRITGSNTSGESKEEFSIESLIFNVETGEGIFDGGTIKQLAEKATTGSTMHISSDLFAKDESGAVALKNSSLTFCEDSAPHWKIKASRLWILPGNEFAFANALLFIGKIPILYLPFFYYPKDELIFNPVFSYDQRKGYSINTTTYLIGRKKNEKKEEDSFFSFMDSSATYKQQREGLVLHNLSETDTAEYPHTLKIKADYYTLLGGMVGLEGSFSPPTVSRLDFSLHLGFSRSIFPHSTNGFTVYVPFDSKGETHYNSSYFMGLKLPFRYQADFNFAISNPLSVKIALPLYSDPYFASDFLDDREETMDWFDFLLGNNTLAEDTDTTEVSSFAWTVSASYNPSFKVIRPYVTSLSVQPDIALNFYSFTDVSDFDSEEKDISPSRKSYFPGLIKPIQLKVSVAGTLFSYPFEKKSPQPESYPKKIQIPAESLTPPKELALLQKESSGTENSEDTDSEETNNDDESEQEEVKTPDLTLPFLNTPQPQIQSMKGLVYNISYTAKSNISTELGYDTPTTRESYTLQNYSSAYVYFDGQLNLTGELNYKDSFIGLKNSIIFSPVYQEHPYYANEQKRDSVLLSDYSARKLDINNTNTISFKPFVYNTIFSNTGLQWDTNIKVLRTEFTGTVQDPQWTYHFPQWDKDSILANNLTFTFSSKIGDYSQQFNFQTKLPPLIQSYSGTLTLGFPFVTLSVGSGLQERDVHNPELYFLPLTQSLKISLFSDKLQLTQNYKYNIDKKYNENLFVKLTGFDFSLSYTMNYTKGFTYNPELGWESDKTEKFRPVSFAFSYSNSGGNTYYFWKNRIGISFGLASELNFNLLQPTSSYFTFTPRINFHINQFLTLSFSSSSRNDVIYRYVQEWTNNSFRIPGETNVFKDLYNSFAFWDEGLRTASGFKLKSLNVELSHDLHDWSLTSQFKVEPRIIQEDGKKRYDFSPYFTLSVLWKPMKDFKTTIEDKYGTFILNP